MRTNRVSAALSESDKTAVLEFLDQAKVKMPFLINLTNKERHRSRKMGPKSVEYVNLNLQGSKTFGTLIPPSVDINEFAKDVSLLKQLLAIRIKLEALLEGVNDTMFAAGSEAMQCADQVYSYLKTGSKSNAGVKSLIADISQRFVKRGKVKELAKV